jgi:hypothetical protein
MIDIYILRGRHFYVRTHAISRIFLIKTTEIKTIALRRLELHLKMAGIASQLHLKMAGIASYWKKDSWCIQGVPVNEQFSSIIF